MSASCELHHIEDCDELTEFVRLNYHALQQDFFDEHVDFLSIEDEFIDIKRKEWLRAPLSPSAKATLLWFASVFERNSCYGKLNDICMLLRDDQRLFPILRSIFLYSARTKTLNFHADMAGISVIAQASDRLFLWQREPF
jgi:hypothetical protein